MSQSPPRATEDKSSAACPAPASASDSQPTRGRAEEEFGPPLEGFVDEAVESRRAHFPKNTFPTGATSKWGLALSGGGIRSATFCAGVLSSFAASGMLLRFDLLSTVSGGGYIGGMLGRLFSRTTKVEEAFAVQAALGSKQAPWLRWWLRANGRYLIPSGTRDVTYAAALFLRNLTAIHLELGLICLLLGIVLAGANAVVWYGLEQLVFEVPVPLFSFLQGLPRWIPATLPTVYLLLPPIAAVGVALSTAYWALPSVAKGLHIWFVWLAVLVGTGLLATAVATLGDWGTPIGRTLRHTSWVATGVLLTIWLIAVPVAWAYLRTTKEASIRSPDAARTALTKSLAEVWRWFGLCVLLGLVDRLAWYLAFELRPDDQVKVGLVLGAIAALFRGVLPLATQLLPNRSSTQPALTAARVVGFVLALALCCWWVSLVHKIVLGALFTPIGLNFGGAWTTMAFLAIPVVGYLFMTGPNLQFLNLSSLHYFYRARLVRSYLGAANPARYGSIAPLAALDSVPVVVPQNLGPIYGADAVPVADVDQGDDIPMDLYQPHRAGGPVHLVNVCVNQTKDPRGGLFNQDRRGLLMTVASGGVKVSQDEWRPLTRGASLTLGAWMAISGAALAPGLGALTRGGVAALTTFAGIRLGYWWDRATRSNGAQDHPGRVAKSRGLLNEASGTFEGTAGENWFLSDGGHFENTGAYALLAERTEVIVVADCGADPDFAFGDLENLVRKARVDLQAEILFQRPVPAASGGAAWPSFSDPAPRPAVLEHFGTLDDLASPNSSACLAFATITYNTPGPASGILIVIKPNLCSGLPVDLVNFRRHNPKFPQETTADQFFSEAQWESYYQLGGFLANKLTSDFIADLVVDCSPYFVPDERSPFETRERKADAPVKPAGENSPTFAGRLPQRLATTAVKTTVGFGAAATVAIGAYQALDGYKTNYLKQVADERSALKELGDLWAGVPALSSNSAREAAVSKLASALVRTADSLCASDEAGWFRGSRLAQRILESAQDMCGAGFESEAVRPPACRLLLESTGYVSASNPASCLSTRTNVELDVAPYPRYWAYDYRRGAEKGDKHPCAQLLDGRGAIEWFPSESTQRAVKACRFSGRLADGVDDAAAAPLALPCANMTVYVKTFGPDGGAAEFRFREEASNAGGNVTPTLDVRAVARSRGEAPPALPPEPTIYYHDARSKTCATTLGKLSIPFQWAVLPLPVEEYAVAGTVDAWIPPKTGRETVIVEHR